MPRWRAAARALEQSAGMRYTWERDRAARRSFGCIRRSAPNHGPMIRETALVSASILLLGTPVIPVSLTADRLRSAFRRMAMVTHPDSKRCDPTGRDFIHVQEAYELLRGHLHGRVGRRTAPAGPAVHRGSGSTRRPGQGTEASGGRRSSTESSAWYWKGGIPKRPLRLGEYLFYTGVISWDMMIRAIVEQRRSRPRLGQLAQEQDLLDGGDLAAGLAARKPGERIGDALRRLGLLSLAEVEELLTEQRRAQKPLGRQLVSLGGVHVQDLPGILARHWKHNRAFAGRG